MNLKQNIIFLIKFFKTVFDKDIRKSYYISFILSIVKIFIVMIPPMLTMKILDVAIPSKNLFYIMILSIFVILTTIFEVLIQWRLALLYNKIGKKIFLLLQRRCIHHIFGLSGEYYNEISTGEVLTTVSEDISRVKDISSSTLLSFIADVIVAICMFFFLGYLQLDLLFMIVLISPLIVYFQRYFNSRAERKIGALREAYGKLASILQSVISNIRSYIFVGRKKFFFDNYELRSEEAASNEVEVNMIFASNLAALEFLSSIITILILGYGGVKVINNTMTIGGLIAFNMYSQKLIKPMLDASNVIMELEKMVISTRKIDALLKTKPGIDLSKSLLKKDKPLKGDIVVKDLAFSYSKTDKVLEDVSLEFRRNTITAIVGESGIGKSTIISLLYRLWDEDEGYIKIDNIDIKEYNLEYLRQNISVISQDVYIFNDTIYNNIALGNKDVTLEMVEEAAKLSCLNDFISTLKDGYNTIVGEGGAKLSGGQKQRISIARQLLKDSPIIIFDEATSALDQITESKIINNFRNISNNKTIIIITHRLSTIKHADRIYVIKDKKVKETGTHNELISMKGEYYNLYNRKLKSAI